MCTFALSFMATQLLAVAFAAPYNANFTANYQSSCSGARKIREGSAAYCNMVDWVAGSLYNTSSFTVYNPGTPLEVQDQDAVAKSLALTMLATGDKSVSTSCQDSVKRLACATAFPYCATTGSSVSSLSYAPPCQLQCTQVNRICESNLYGQPQLTLECSSLSTNRNCLLKIPGERFLLQPDQVT